MNEQSIIDRYTLADLERWDEIAREIAPPIRLGVFGDPVAHSMSPIMMNAAFRRETVNAVYLALHAKTLKGQQLTFAVSSQTKVVLHHGAAIVGGDHGIVKVRGPKNLTAGAAQALVVQQLIDQGKKK